DTSTGHTNLERLAEETFKEVFGMDTKPEIDIKLPPNPKEISSKGGLSIVDHKQLNLDDIKATLITDKQLQSKDSKISYERVKEFEDQAIESFDTFLQFFFKLNKSYSFRDNFGIEKDSLDFTQAFLDKK